MIQLRGGWGGGVLGHVALTALVRFAPYLHSRGGRDRGVAGNNPGENPSPLYNWRLFWMVSNGTDTSRDVSDICVCVCMLRPR